MTEQIMHSEAETALETVLQKHLEKLRNDFKEPMTEEQEELVRKMDLRELVEGLARANMSGIAEIVGQGLPLILALPLEQAGMEDLIRKWLSLRYGITSKTPIRESKE